MGIAGGLFVRRLAVVVATVLLSSFAVLGTPLAAHAEGEGTILSLVNQARAANNLGPLRLNSSISAVSAAWANQMAANGEMTHNPSYSSQIPGGWSRAAENVAQGYGSPSAVHSGWMNSSGHRANILGDFTDIGIAFITSGGTTWAVENFGKYGASVPPPAPPAPPPAPPLRLQHLRHRRPRHPLRLHLRAAALLPRRHRPVVARPGCLPKRSRGSPRTTPTNRRRVRARQRRDPRIPGNPWSSLATTARPRRALSTVACLSASSSGRS